MKLLIVLLFITFTHISFSQQTGTIKGRVTDEKGDPFPSVNIFLPTSKTGTITNSDGRFSLDFPGSDKHLSISFMGYETQSVNLHESTGFINIQLKPSPTQLNEVVISNLSAAGMLRKAIETIPENYPLEPFLAKTYYRGQFSEEDTLLYLEETAFDVIKSYRPSFSDKYYLIRNRNFRFRSTQRVLRGIAHFDVVKNIDRTFDGGFFRNYTISYKPGTE